MPEFELYEVIANGFRVLELIFIFDEDDCNLCKMLKLFSLVIKLAIVNDMLKLLSLNKAMRVCVLHFLNMNIAYTI